MAVNPEEGAVERFAHEGPDGPIVMLNLLRFAEDGVSAYQEYSRVLLKTLLPRYGAEVVYAGTGSTALVAEDGQDWDAVVVVRYPDRQAFARMVADPDYRAAAHLRTRALSEAVLQATTAWG